MPLNLRLFVIIFSIILTFTTIRILIKGRISEKYSLIWLAISFIIFLVGFVPNFVTDISKVLGFEVMSNMIIAIILVLIVFITMTLTVMIAGQKKKTTLLIQELSILQKKVEEKEKKQMKSFDKK
ncbi:MAG: DUF2304 domain-containing protein [Bacilli bacterium]|nr:DUF2304 domain-containing protein [Bacilli bacterium]